MRFKPPVPRKRRTQALLAFGVALATLSGLTLSQVSPAMADPTVQLVAVGSDTVQDVYNQFAIDFGGNKLGSYNAVNPVSGVANEVITPDETYSAPAAAAAAGTTYFGCSFTRPNGSGGGIKALRESLNPGTTVGGGIHGTAAAPQPGCVDIARSSSGPDGNGTNGAIVWIPFAEDGVTGATGPAAGSGFPATPYTYSYAAYTGGAAESASVTPQATNITTADDFTLVDLKNLYAGCQTITEGTITYWPYQAGVSQPANTQQIDLYVPQLNSGTRNFWASTLGFNPTNLPPCVHDELTGDSSLATATGGVPVEEHNGTPFASDPDGYGPFSIAQWVSQRNGNDDRRHDAVLHELANCTNVVQTQVGTYPNPTPPPATLPLYSFTGTCTAAVSPYNPAPSTPDTYNTPGNLNSAFPIHREVYSVVSYTSVTTPGNLLYNLLNNASPISFLCGEQTAILNYGFALIPNATVGDSCGAVLPTNREGD